MIFGSDLVWILSIVGVAWSYPLEPTGDGRRLSPAENQLLNQTCGQPPSSSRGFRSLYGTPADQGDAPWAAAMVYSPVWYPEMSEQQRESIQRLHCSASLISPRHVITAASCIGVSVGLCQGGIYMAAKTTHRNLDRFRIYLGGRCAHPARCKELNRGDELLTRKVIRAFFPMHFQDGRCPQTKNVGDMAVLELDEDVPFSQFIYPICLSSNSRNNGSDESFSKEPLTSYGYGIDDAQDRAYGAPVGVLKSTTQYETSCNSSIEETAGAFHTDMFCLQSEFTSNCVGDTGAGVVVLSSGRRSLVGSLVKQTDCMGKDTQNRMGRVAETTLIVPNKATDVLFHLHWICQVAGICPRQENIEIVSRLFLLPPTSRPRWVSEAGPVPKDEMFVF